MSEKCSKFVEKTNFYSVFQDICWRFSLSVLCFFSLPSILAFDIDFPALWLVMTQKPNTIKGQGLETGLRHPALCHRWVRGVLSCFMYTQHQTVYCCRRHIMSGFFHQLHLQINLSCPVQNLKIFNLHVKQKRHWEAGSGEYLDLYVREMT